MIEKLSILSRMYKDLGDTKAHNTYKYLIKKVANMEITEDDLQDWVKEDIAELDDMHIHNAFDKVGDDMDEDVEEDDENLFYEKDHVLGYLDNLIEQVQEGMVDDLGDPVKMESVILAIIDIIEEMHHSDITKDTLASLTDEFSPEHSEIVESVVELINENLHGVEGSEGMEEDEDEEEFNQYQEQIENAVTALSRLPGAPHKNEIKQEIEEMFYSEESNKDPQVHLDDIVEELWDMYSMKPDDDTMLEQDSDVMLNPKSLSALERKRLEDETDPLKNYPHFSKGFGGQEIAEAAIIQDLIKLADSLDKKDLVQEADFVDSIINSIQRG